MKRLGSARRWFVPPTSGGMLVILLLAGAGLGSGWCFGAEMDAFAQNRRLGRGVNILGYDPIWRSPDQARLREKHFQRLQEAGFDSVRINLHPFRHTGREDNWKLPEGWWRTVDWAVTQALDHDLTVILDLHEFNAMAEDPEGRHGQFLATWRQLADHYQRAPDRVLFEILNEPSRALTPELWNRYLREALALIRESNPTRTVIVGPPFWNSIGHLEDLDLPADDRHLIVTVHYYTPMEFTHQGAAWSSHRDKSNITWSGSPKERNAVREDFAKAADWAQRMDRPILLGEFGAYDQAPMESRIQYTEAVARTAESFGWSWAYWQLDSDFILYDIDRDAWVQPIRDALIPPGEVDVRNHASGELNTGNLNLDRVDSSPASPPVAPIGQFTMHTDVGPPALKGSAVYDAMGQHYTVRGAGTNMWFGEDEFHFVWKQLQGDFIVRARARFPDPGVDPHRKLGWMARTTLETGSPHINAVVHGDGLTSLQFRRTDGADTEERRSPLTGADVVQLERKGDRFTMSVARFGEPFVTTESADLELGQNLFVGLFVCSHNPDVVEEAVFEDVRITIPAPHDFVPYRDYLGSRLETLNVETGARRIVYRTPDGIEAPNWTPDGAALIYNSRGRLYHFPLASREPSVLDTGFATQCNNDHVLSFDGRRLGISHHTDGPGGGSRVYTLPVTGGTPRLVTDKSPSYLHGWSPDGESLLYTGERNGDFDIYRISVKGGEETRLTTAKGLDDGSEYGPDGRWIYFNSARTGTMQLWRMKPDGTGQEQLTHDAFQDWFPHVSPDGRHIVFLSFPPDVAADDHPYYQRVLLRWMPVDGGKPRIIAYLYGGQGTINVPSWSPDSRHIAFVSFTGS